MDSDLPSSLAGLAGRMREALADPEVRLAQEGLDECIVFHIGRISIGLAPGPQGYQVAEPAAADATVRLEAEPEVWAAALETLPRPGYHSFTALRRAGHLRMSGDPISFARALHLLERLLELVRGQAHPVPAAGPPRDMAQIAGRYHHLASPGGDATVYAESAGTGAPILFLHTAGADSRQFQAVLSDVALARRWRLQAFDLPMHGRSMPPQGWDGGRWVLTQARYAELCVAFLEQVVAAPAVVVGCSMGAAMALVLAATRPDLLQGAVAVSAPFRARGRQSPLLAHAAVNSSAHNPSYVRGLMGPAASDAARRAATWIYGQGALGVYAGDLAFYSDEFDGGAIAPRIDSGRCPVAFLTGAYDYSAPPDDARKLASSIARSTVQLMPELGHFPMIEDPDRFRTYLVPALDWIAARARRA